MRLQRPILRRVYKINKGEELAVPLPVVLALLLLFVVVVLLLHANVGRPAAEALPHAS